MILTLFFPPPGFFMADFPVEVRVDGEARHRGSFVAGFRLEITLDPGAHVVETVIGGAFARKRRYVVEVPEGVEARVATLDYSRMWGNFTEELRVEEGGLAPMPERAYAPPEPEVPSQPVRVTWAILGVLIAVFLLEYALAVSPREGLAPSVATLTAMGGLGATALKDLELQRLLTCTLLHADPVHLLLNAVSLVLAGSLVERKLGAFWFFVVYTASAIGGSFMSLALNTGNIVSIGASGAILGVFAAGMVLAGAYPVEQRPALRMQLARVLVPSLLFPLFQRHGDPVDVGAHLGGALAGGVMGYTLLGPLRASAGTARPLHGTALGKGLAAVALVATLAAAAVVAVRTYPESRAVAAVMGTILPNEDLPKGAPTEEQWAAWRKKYPGDPRVLLHDGDLALRQRDAAEYERALLEGRAAVKRTAPAFLPESVAAFSKDFDLLEGDRGLLLLMGDADLPSGSAEEVSRGWGQKLPTLLAKFPKDPRVRYENAFALYGKVDPTRVLEEITLARELGVASAKFFPNGLDQRSLMALELMCYVDLGRDADVARLRPRVCGGAEGEITKRVAARVCAPQR